MASLSAAFPIGRVFSTNLPTATQTGHARRLEGRIVLDLTNALDTAAPRGVLIAEVDDMLVAIDARRAHPAPTPAPSMALMSIPKA
jgi:hypothetical protein